MRAAGRHRLNVTSVDHRGGFPPDGIAIVIGATGGIGSALSAHLTADGTFGRVVRFARNTTPGLDLLSESTIADCARTVAQDGRDVRLIIDATGILRGDGVDPEKSLRQLDAAQMAKVFAINAIGPALLMKHFLPLLPREGKSVFATLSARVGSIGDNRLGGWYSYRASKAALNQLVRTAAIELHRRNRDAICIALHPGTVDTKLSSAFARDGLEVHTPDAAAAHLVRVIKTLSGADSGGFFAWNGETVTW